LTGSSPKIQNLRPSRLTSGKMKRLVKVLSVRLVAIRLSRLIRLFQKGD